MKKRILILTLLSLVMAPSVTMARTHRAPHHHHISANGVKDKWGCTVGFENVGKKIFLIFSADSAFEGATTILETLKRHNAKGSFFFTGNCLRYAPNAAKIERVKAEGHFIGGHSDGHILYADWDTSRTTLVTRDSLQADLKRNMLELKYALSLFKKKPLNYYFLPPYEWYNKETLAWVEETGLKPVCFTPGVGTSDDYTTPDMGEKCRSSQQLIDKLYQYEQEHGLDGAIVLIHPGTSPSRTDKLYDRLDEIMTHLEQLGYSFERLP